MNKQFNAVALANKRLRQENMELWAKIDEQERGIEEMKAAYDALILQLVTVAGGQVFIPKVDVKKMTRANEVKAERGEDGMLLFVAERDDEGNGSGENDAERQD